MGSELTLTLEEKAFLEHMFFEIMNLEVQGPAHAAIQGLGGGDVRGLVTFFSRELGRLVEERPAHPVVCPWTSKEELAEREKAALAAVQSGSLRDRMAELQKDRNWTNWSLIELLTEFLVSKGLGNEVLDFLEARAHSEP